ncbi:MAG: hypothetical protein R6V67_10570 [Spirochaetia bacterium]
MFFFEGWNRSGTREIIHRMVLTGTCSCSRIKCSCSRTKEEKFR